MTHSPPRPMKIAYLTGEYPRATDTFIQREVAALRGHGLEVATCSIRQTGPEHLVGPEQKSEAAGTFYALKAARNPLRLMRDHLMALTRSPARYARALALAWRVSAPGLRARLYQLIYFAEAAVLTEHLRREAVVHLHNHIATASCTVAMLASEMSGIPYSFTLHGPDIFFEPHRWRLDEKIARARFVACISDFCRAQAMVFSAPPHWPKLHVVHCGIDPAQYAADENREAGARLLFVGRLAAVKGLPVLFEAMQRLLPEHPDMHLTLIGDGPERPALEQDAAARDLTKATLFAGYKSQSDVAQALREADIFVLPSFAEGVPVVLMEAMAAGKPVITTRIAGVPELVEHGRSGLLVAPGDATGLADAIATLLADATLRVRMGENGRATVRDAFNIDRESRWLADLFENSGTAEKPLGKRPKRGGDA